MINQERNRSTLPAGDLIPEHRGCGLPGRRRRIAATTANRAESGRSISRAVDVRGASSSAKPAAILRRWSVAELIARAAVRPVEGAGSR